MEVASTPRPGRGRALPGFLPHRPFPHGPDPRGTRLLRASHGNGELRWVGSSEGWDRGDRWNHGNHGNRRNRGSGGVGRAPAADVRAAWRVCAGGLLSVAGRRDGVPRGRADGRNGILGAHAGDEADGTLERREWGED